jgi:serine/threonine protein kinase
MALEVNSLLYNRYRIDEIIAEGGMGAIYRGFDQSLGVQVAIKENLFTAENSTRQFRREATLLAGLRHPNLPRVTDHFSIADQGQYLVMDFIEGQDMRQRLLTSGPIPENEVVAIGSAVCQALQYLHSRQPPVIHRDIKPGNIKVNSNGQVFLVDFGLAREAAPGQATTTGARALTPGYAPPEQYGQGTTPLSDIYSLGATLYAALTANIPEDALARAMGSAHLTPVRKYNPRVSDYTAHVIEKALSVRPQDRYQSAEEMHLALMNSPEAPPQIQLQSEPVNFPQINDVDVPTLHREHSSYPLTSQFPTVETPQIIPNGSAQPAVQVKEKWPFPFVWVFVAVAFVAIVAGGVILLPGWLNTPVIPSSTPILSTSTPRPVETTAAPIVIPPTQTPSATASPSPSLTLTSTPLPPTPTQLPTDTVPAPTPLGGGSGQIAYASSANGARPQIWLVDSTGGNPRQLTHISDGACQPAWSPDGKKLVFITPCIREQDEYPGAVLFLINADGSQLEPLPSLPGGDFDPAWSPDGSQIAFTSLREGIAHIFTMQLSDHKVERISGAYSDDRRPAWSPDEAKIAFESTRLGQKQIWTMGSKGESPAEFTKLAEGAAFNPIWGLDATILYYNRDSGLPWIYARRTDSIQNPEAKLTDLRPVLRPRISADGQWIVYESWSGSSHNIFIMSIAGINHRALTNDENYNFDPVWKP